VVNIADSLDDNSLFQKQLPLVNKSIAQVLDLPGRLRTNLQQPIQDYFAADSTPTVQELITVIKQKILSFKRDTTGGNDKIFKFDLDLHDALTATALPIDLGADAAGIGLGLDASAKLDLAAALKFVDRNNLLLPKFSFGVNADPDVDPSEAFFISVDKLIVSGSVHANNLNFGAHVGILSAGVKNGVVNLDANLDLLFNDPNNDGRITFSELTGTPLDQLVTLTPTGALAVTLPIQATVSGADL